MSSGFREDQQDSRHEHADRMQGEWYTVGGRKHSQNQGHWTGNKRSKGMIIKHQSITNMIHSKPLVLGVGSS